MPQQPHPVLLNREAPAQFMSQYFPSQLDLLKQLTDYGSHLVLNSFHAGEANPTSAIICGSMLKHVVVMLDACEVLLRSGSIYAANIPARSAFEASVHVQWMLEGDTENRVRHYTVAELRRDLNWARRAAKGTVENESFVKMMGTLDADVHKAQPQLSGDAHARVPIIEELLANKHLAPVNLAFDLLKKKRKRPHEPHWYEVLGVNSIRQIAKLLNLLPDYELMYTSASEVVHAGSFRAHIEILSDRAVVKPIRDTQGASVLIQHVLGTAVRIYRVVTAHYLPGELNKFYQTYLEEWRDAFLNVPNVEVATVSQLNVRG